MSNEKSNEYLQVRIGPHYLVYSLDDLELARKLAKENIDAIIDSIIKGKSQP